MAQCTCQGSGKLGLDCTVRPLQSARVKSHDKPSQDLSKPIVHPNPFSVLNIESDVTGIDAQCNVPVESKPVRPRKNVPRAKGVRMVQASKIRSAAHGAGMLKAQRMGGVQHPVIEPVAVKVAVDSQQVPAVPHVQAEQLTANIISDTHCVQLQLSEGLDDSVKLSLHCTEGCTYTVHTAEGHSAPKPAGCVPCKQIGTVRTKHIEPYHTHKYGHQLLPDTCDTLLSLVQDYDGLNGHVCPVQEDWTMAFADPRGQHKHFGHHWSAIDNPFKHNWYNTHVCAFPDMNDDVIKKTLEYHCIQQQLAHRKSISFRGLYVVPYKPHSNYWKYIPNFNILKVYRKGDIFYGHVTSPKLGKINTSKLSPVTCSETMYVLYDPGYTAPNYGNAYVNALSKCFDHLPEDFVPSILDNSLELYSSTFLEQNVGEVGNADHNNTEKLTVLPEFLFAFLHNLPALSIKDIDITQLTATSWEVECDVNHTEDHIASVHIIHAPFQDWQNTAVWPAGMVVMPVVEFQHDKGRNLSINCSLRQLHLYNSVHCNLPPDNLPEQYSFGSIEPDETAMAVIRKMQSIGKLTNVLEEGDPDWDQVDQAVREHVQILQEQQEVQEQTLGKQELDPTLFSKPWTQGGLMPIGTGKVRQVQHEPLDESLAGQNLCLVVKTKVSNQHCNTCLVDEGATHSVFNIDWYENQNIDWKAMLGISQLNNPTTMYLADETPAEVLGIHNISMELLDAKGKKFEHSFYLMRLGKHNYAQILGFDWKLRFHTVTALPEYTIQLRKLHCTIPAHPVPVRLYQMMSALSPTQGPDTDVKLTCEEATPQEIMKDIRLLSARLRRFHLHVPSTAFLRQIIIRPVTSEDEAKKVSQTPPDRWVADDDLEKRAVVLRERIEQTYRKEYSDVLDCEPKGINNKMPHQHIIEVPPGTDPYSQKLKRLSPLEIKLLGEYLQEMVDGGRIRPSDSPWGANVLFVPKPCGGFRCCQDYRELNKRMKHDTYPLPRIDVHMDLAQGSFWSKMDLLKGFYQLPMESSSIPYTAFNTLLGKYEFLVMPMGLQNAPGSFMRAMNHIFDGLIWDPNMRQQSGILVYLDDILIFSQTEDQHMEILKKVLDRLRKFGLQCRFDKCSFAVTEVDYLGFKLSHQGVRMDPGKVEIVKQWSDMPKSKTEIRAFLGIVNYLKRFCHGLSHHSALLSDWASETSCDDWTDHHKGAMQSVKDLLCGDEILACPKVDEATGNYFPFTVITDASEIAVGAILLQQQGPDKANTRVIGYHSVKFKSAEKNYSVHEKELLGVLMAVQHWNCFLEGSKFTVYTDHSSLIWLNKLKEPSRRQARWVDILQGHDFEVLYVKGVDNPADAFTRVPWPSTFVDDKEDPIREPLVIVRRMHTALIDAGISLRVSPSKLKEWRDITQKFMHDNWKIPPLYSTIMQGYIEDPLYSDNEWISNNQLTFKDGLFFKNGKVAIPDIFEVKKDVLIESHDSLNGGHLGINKTLEKVKRCFWWAGMNLDIENHVKICPACQLSKYRCHKPKGQTFDFQPATSPWEVVHVDFAGPFKHTAPGGYNRICVFTDSFTKLAIFVKCKTTITSEKLADLYIEHVWKVYGRPGKLVSDNEPILCAEAWTKIHAKLGTKLSHIAAYNAKANGAAEVMVKQLKSMLRAYEVQGVKWWNVLSACERGYNDSIHSATGFTPFYMNFGRHPYMDVTSFLEDAEEQFVQEFVHSVQFELAQAHGIAQDKIRAKQVRDTAGRNEHRTPAEQYKVGEYVMIETSAIKKSHSLAPLRTGPFKIKSVTANGNACYLEGFRHPFNVVLLTPALVWANGVETHLSKMPACPTDVNEEHIIPQQDQGEHLAVTPNQVDDTQADSLQPTAPLCTIEVAGGQQPGHALNGEVVNLSQHITDIPSYVIIPAQLPGNIVQILEMTGRSRNSATLLCLLDNGDKCRIGFRHLKTILGDLAFNVLFHTYDTHIQILVPFSYLHTFAFED